MELGQDLHRRFGKGNRTRHVPVSYIAVLMSAAIAGAGYRRPTDVTRREAANP
jgi:hypothetical protein